VLGALVRRHGRFDACEDAVQAAPLAASVQWPEHGIPENPRGWLLSVASRRLIDELRYVTTPDGWPPLIRDPARLRLLPTSELTDLQRDPDVGRIHAYAAKFDGARRGMHVVRVARRRAPGHARCPCPPRDDEAA
jgi:DNA-directed RNA polymerase specialized sigma24 family protein